MDQKAVEKIAHDFDLTPSKSKGQNFLINEKVIKEIVKVSGVEVSSKVLEIGPGLGVLTKKLLEVVDKVLVVELDDKAVRFLRSYFKNSNKLKIWHKDILRVKNHEIAKELGQGYEVVANIPYNITSKIIRKFLTYEPKPRSLTLMLQKEVAERIVAQPGKMSILAVSVQFYAEVLFAFEVRKDNFWPKPEVDSAVVKIIPNDRHLSRLKITEAEFFRIVKFGFSAKRKKLANNLAAGLRIPTAQAQELLQQLDLKEGVRAQQLSVQDWLNLAHLVFGKK